MSYFVTNHALVTDHFGSWPSFHDAEIVRLTIDRSTEDMHIDIITFLMTKETDAKGNFKRDKECTIRFKLQGIYDLDLKGFNSQNVVARIDFERVDSGLKMILSPSFGLNGEISCKQIEVAELLPIK